MASSASCHEKQASSAVAGSPSDHFMPSRMWNVQDCPSAARSHGSAKPGHRLEVRAEVDEQVVAQLERLVADDEQGRVRVQGVEVLGRPDPQDDGVGRRRGRRRRQERGRRSGRRHRAPGPCARAGSIASNPPLAESPTSRTPAPRCRWVAVRWHTRRHPARLGPHARVRRRQTIQDVGGSARGGSADRSGTPRARRPTASRRRRSARPRSGRGPTRTCSRGRRRAATTTAGSSGSRSTTKSRSGVSV